MMTIHAGQEGQGENSRAKNTANDANYQDTLDIEIAMRGEGLDVGVFGPKSRVDWAEMEEWWMGLKASFLDYMYTEAGGIK